MPRRNREHSGIGIYHVMLRGINHQDIFESSDDYAMFLSILHHLVDRQTDDGESLPPYCTIYCYCLMNNHVHLLIREREESISDVVKRIGVSYVRYYNDKYERNGPLFQDRFRSEPVNTIEYFMTLLRYIHQNPVKSGLVSEVKDYRWSSWSEYEGRNGILKICDTRTVMNRLDSDNVYEYVTMPVYDEILDVDNDIKSSITDEDLKSYVIGLTHLNTSLDVSSLSKKERNEVIKQLCEYGANIRQISRVTGVPYGVIYRINRKQ